MAQQTTAEQLDRQFCHLLMSDDLSYYQQSTPLDFCQKDKSFWDTFISACFAARQFDLQSRVRKELGQTYYTIGSSGHEGNAILGVLSQIHDPALLHYRSAAFQLARAARAQLDDRYLDMALSFVASKLDPISGGRHKVLGSYALNIPPQTSTIASHGPKAVGLAYAIRLAKELSITKRYPDDSVVICSFGDASFNHSTMQGALNAACYIVRKRCPLPIVFVCEDNGLGISVPTPEDWIALRMQNNPLMPYIACHARDLAALTQTAMRAIDIARMQKRPVFLHIKTVRLLGHAGSDVETTYRTVEQIQQTLLEDPLLYYCKAIASSSYWSLSELLTKYQLIAEQVHEAFERALLTAKHQDATSIMDSIIAKPIHQSLPALPSEVQRKACFANQYKQVMMPRIMAQTINIALADLLLQYPNVVIFGEDVATKGGVYAVTSGLKAKFGARRVFDTLLDEQTILGHAIGLAQNGFLPIPEIQFLAYYHNAEDQIRGEAATLPFFSNGQYSNPMVVRIPGFAYQKGFGGHFHNDNSIAALTDIPGVIVAAPSNPQDAALMLRTCVAKAYLEQRVILFLEPIALYMTKDLLTAKDNGWMMPYPELSLQIPFGEVGVYGNAKASRAILTFANGYYLARQAVAQLTAAGVDCQDIKIIDLRWLAPLPFASLALALQSVNQLLIVDETREQGALTDGLYPWLLSLTCQKKLTIDRITAKNSFIPLGNAWQYVLPSREDIINKLQLLGA